MLSDVDALPLLRELTRRHTPHEGIFQTALTGVTLIRGDSPSAPTPLLYTPRLCIGIEGDKELAVGDTLVHYGPGEELVASLALPVTGKIVTAPYLAFAMDLDPVEIAEMQLELPPNDDTSSAIITGPACPLLLDAVTRAVRMLDNPTEVAMLGPLVRREIIFRVLSGPRGGILRRIAQDRGHVAQVAKAIVLLRAHFAEPLDPEALAQKVGMSVTSFYRHFKTVTAMSPLQYQKQLRLQEARHLLLGEAIDVGTVSARVGYESTTHFTREYAKLFGAPPRRDAERLRASLTGA